MERRHELKLEVAKYERILQKSTENQVDQVEEAIRGCIRLVGNVDDLKPFVYGREVRTSPQTSFILLENTSRALIISSITIIQA